MMRSYVLAVRPGDLDPGGWANTTGASNDCLHCECSAFQAVCSRQAIMGLPGTSHTRAPSSGLKAQPCNCADTSMPHQNVCSWRSAPLKVWPAASTYSTRATLSLRRSPHMWQQFGDGRKRTRFSPFVSSLLFTAWCSNMTVARFCTIATAWLVGTSRVAGTACCLRSSHCLSSL
eukprot:4848612-Amphidinium_carterae.1